MLSFDSLIYLTRAIVISHAMGVVAPAHDINYSNFVCNPSQSTRSILGKKVLQK